MNRGPTESKEMEEDFGRSYLLLLFSWKPRQFHKYLQHLIFQQNRVWTRSPRRNKIVSFFALLLPYLLHSLLVTQNCLLPFSHGGWHTYRGILLECKIGPLQAGIKSSLSDICSIIAWILEERIAFRPFP